MAFNPNASPDPIDVEVGLAIRRLRKRCDITQDQLGRAIGVTFQQVQKSSADPTASRRPCWSRPLQF